MDFERVECVPCRGTGFHPELRCPGAHARYEVCYEAAHWPKCGACGGLGYWLKRLPDTRRVA